MQSTVRRIRTNVARMQAQLNSIESVATQVPLIRPSIQSTNVNASFPIGDIISTNKEIFELIDQQINSVSKRINDIVTRLNLSLTANSSLMGQPLNPIITLNSIIQNQSNRDPLIKQPKN